MPGDDPLDRLEAFLRTARPTRSWVGVDAGGGHANKRRVELEGGLVVVAKLADEGVLLRQARAEAAAWKIARTLGWADLMSATVYRELDLEGLGQVEGSVQVFWSPCEWVPSIDRFEDQEILRAAVFDVLIRNTDRGGNNWLGVAPEGQAQALKLIDHGHALMGQGDVSSSFADVKVGTPLTDDVVEALRLMTEDALRANVANLVPEEVVSDLAARAHVLATLGSLDKDPRPQGGAGL